MALSSLYFNTDRDAGLSPTALGLVLVVHAFGIWLLATQRQAVAELIERPIMISLIAAEPEAKPVPVIEPPKVIQPVPKPVRKTPVPKPQPEMVKPSEQLVAQAPASSPAPEVEASPSVPMAEAPPPAALPSQPTEAVAQEEVIQQPRFNADYLNNPAPAYPPLSRRLREEGTVLLRVHVDAEGAAEQVTLHQSSGHSRLDERALDTVKRWKFVPARQGGQAVAAWVIVPIQFSLKG